LARRARAARAPKAKSAHVLWHVPRNALRSALRRVLHVPVLHVSSKGSAGGRWKMARATMNTFTNPPSAATNTSSATSRVTRHVLRCVLRRVLHVPVSLTCSSFTCHLRASARRGFRRWQMAMDKTNTFTMNTFILPSFAAPNTPSATSCAKSFTCVFHVSPKGKRGGTCLLPSHTLRCSKAQHALRHVYFGTHTFSTLCAQH